MLSNLDPLTDMVAPKGLVGAVYHQLITDPAQCNDVVECVRVDFCSAQWAPRADFKRLCDAAKTERVSNKLRKPKASVLPLLSFLMCWHCVFVTQKHGCSISFTRMVH